MDANRCLEETLDALAGKVGDQLSATPMAILGPILGNLDLNLRRAVESIPTANKRSKAAVIVDTEGGVVEVVERMVGILRYHFSELHFIIPDRAMSAGTIFAMSGDAVWMDYFSCLGPIDPQIERDGKLVPALSYVVQFEQLVRKSLAGEISPAELILLQKLDLGDLHFYEQARNLSIDLLVEWLSRYKFKDWHRTETRKVEVDDATRQARAKEIAEALSDNTRWKTHGRPITMKVLTEQLNLRINDFVREPEPAGRDSRLFRCSRRLRSQNGKSTDGSCYGALRMNPTEPPKMTALDELLRRATIDSRVLEIARNAGEMLRRLGLLSTEPAEAIRPFRRRPASLPKQSGVAGWAKTTPKRR